MTPDLSRCTANYPRILEGTEIRAQVISYIIIYHTFVKFFFVLEACRLELEQPVCLLLRDQSFIPQGPQEALALLNVSGTQVPLIVDEIV